MTDLKTNDLKKVLIILPRQLGDVLLGTSLARALKAAVPGVQVSWLAHPMARQILQDHPYIDEVFYSKGEFKKDWALLKILREKKFDAVIDAIALPRTALLAKLIGARERISYRTRWSRNFLYTKTIARERLDEAYLGYTRLLLLEPLLEPLGIFKKDWADANVEPLLPIFESDRQKAAAVTKDILELNKECKKFVVLSPTHRRDVRRWPGEKFVELALHFAQAKIAVVWLWGPGEEEFVKGLHQRLEERLTNKNISRNYSFFPPLLTLRETAALCTNALGFVGNCNGLSHIAVAGGAKTLRLQGPTLSRVWTHPDTTRHIGIDAGCIEACLGKNSCQNQAGRCLEKLSVDMVWDKAQSLFEADASASI